MTVATDIQIRARRRIGIHEDEQPYPAVESSADFDMLTDMLNYWALDGAITSFTAVSVSNEVVLTFADDATLQDEATHAIAANLAARLADNYDQPLPQSVIFDAERGYSVLLKKQHLALMADESSYDSALSYMPSQRTKTILGAG